MTTVFWGADDLKRKLPHLAKKRIVSRQDSASLLTCVATLAKYKELGYELLPHLLYSPNWVPGDNFWFRYMKKCLDRKRSAFRNEIICQTFVYFWEFRNKTFFGEKSMYHLKSTILLTHPRIIINVGKPLRFKNTVWLAKGPEAQIWRCRVFFGNVKSNIYQYIISKLVLILKTRVKWSVRYPIRFVLSAVVPSGW